MLFVMTTNIAFSQINVNKLKDKVKSEVNKNLNSNDAGNTNNSNNSNVTKGNSSTMPDAQAKQMRDYYESRIEVAKSWPFEVHPNTFQPTMFDYIETLNMPEFEKQMQADKAKYPALFKFHGMESQKPSGMEFGSGGSGQSNDENLKWINLHITKYYEWKDKIVKQQQQLAQVVQKYIVDAEQARDNEKIEKAALAVRAANALKSIQPDNPMVDDLIKTALTVQDKSFDDIKHIFASQVHKENYKKVVGFKAASITIGKEDKSLMSNEIVAGEPFTIVAYFGNYMKDLGLTSNASGLPLKVAPTMEWQDSPGNDYNIFARQRMFSSKATVEKLHGQSYFVFELFPDPATVKYQSHLEYIPHLNFVKWLTFQMPGEYTYYFKFTGGAVDGGDLATGSFKIKLTREGIDKCKAYYEKLREAKIKAVTFNDEYGCVDSKAKIGSKNNMEKYGELIKLTCAQTGQVMKPWPNDNIVNNYTGQGYGVFKQADGTYEIISVQFSRSPSSSEFDFAGISIMNDYELNGSVNIRAELKKNGYEMTKEGIDKCAKW